MSFAFLILHYEVIEETIKAVESIKKYMNEYDYNIVIVDNASKNKTGKKLQEIYNLDSNISVILNPKNLGFARGNNIGIEYILNNLEFDFLVAMNNDTQLISDSFANLIIDDYNRYKFAILGPKIKLRNNEYYYVIEEQPSINTIKRDMKKQKLLRVLNKIGIRDFLFKLLKNKQVNKQKHDDNINQFHENILLNGCFLVFSKEFFKHYRGFSDRTFMYREEEFLYFMCQKEHLKMIYDPKIEVFHNEDAATDAVIKNSRAKNEFFYKNSIDSMKEIVKFLNKNN